MVKQVRPQCSVKSSVAEVRVGRGTDSEGFVSQAEGGGTCPHPQWWIHVLDTALTAPGSMDGSRTRGRKPTRRQL